MKTYKNLIDYIINKIDFGEWKINMAIPKEKDLVKQTGLSKMTIRKALDFLIQNEILYAVKGRGTYISEMHKFQRFSSLKERLEADEILQSRTSTLKPKLFIKEFNIDFENEEAITRIYFKRKKPLGYSINWLNLSSEEKENFDISKIENDIFKVDNFDKVININTFEPMTEVDKRILEIDHEYIPTTISVYYQKNRKILMVRIAKIHPNKYKSFSFMKSK